MEIKEYIDEFFNNSKRIKIYNSYEPYNLLLMRRYCEKNNIECVEASDTDLDIYLKYFTNVKYLHLSSEANHLEEVNNLKNLKGISLCNNQLKEIDDDILENIEYLELFYYDKKQVDFSKFKSLKHLRLLRYPFDYLEIKNDLYTFEIDYAPKLNILNGVNANNLRNLKLENIRNLQMIELECPKLSSFYIYDSKKVINLESFLEQCKLLESIVIISYTDTNANLKSLQFITELNLLEEFRTNFRILDGDLKPLLKLKEVAICRFYRNYNLKDKDLPHITVCITEGNFGYRVRLDSLALGKDDPRIMWLE